MGKRSQFERRERDAYDTPAEAVRPLLPHLKPGTKFVEPCYGNGKLADALINAGHSMVMHSDIVSGGLYTPYADATAARFDHLGCLQDDRTVFITNPPWSRDVLHPIIENLCRQAPTWLLFDADWMHTLQSEPFMWNCHKIVSVGRVRWIAGTKMTGKDNCAWYLFGRAGRATEFFGRNSVEHLNDMIGKAGEDD